MLGRLTGLCVAGRCFDTGLIQTVITKLFEGSRQQRRGEIGRGPSLGSVGAPAFFLGYLAAELQWTTGGRTAV